MIGLRSLRNRLAVVFGLIVLGAIGTIYLTVTPRLEERLQDQKLERLQADASRYVEGKTGWAQTYNTGAEEPEEPLPEARLRPAAADVSAEVLILDVLAGSPVSLSGQFDSAPDGGDHRGRGHAAGEGGGRDPPSAVVDDLHRRRQAGRGGVAPDPEAR